MRLDDDLLLELIGTFYAAALTPTEWPRALERLSDAFGGGALYVGIQRLPRGVPLLVAVRTDPAFADVFKERFAAPADSGLHNPMTSLPASALFLRHEFIDTPSFHRSPLYQEFLRPQGMDEYGQAILMRTSDFVVPMAIARRAGSGTFDDTERDFLERLLPHLGNCMQIQLRLETARIETAGLGATLDQLPVAVLLLDASGRVLRTNAAADTLLDTCDGLAIRDRRAAATSKRETDRLDQLIATATATATGARRAWGCGGMMALSRPALGRPLSVLVSPLPARAKSSWGVGAAAVMLVRDPDIVGAVSGNHLIDLYGLTGAEARVATTLLGTDDPREVAAQLGIGMATLRTHLHRLYDKTGTRRQAELVRLLMALALP